jgi:hypothetical protein
MGPGAAISAPSAPEIGGPSCRLWLRPSGGDIRLPGVVMGTRRGRSMRPDGDVTRPLAVDSDCSGEFVAATIFVAIGSKIILCDIIVYIRPFIQ